MQYKDLLDNDSTEKLLKRASEDKELPGKILNSEFVSNKVSSGMEKLSEKADGASSMVKNLMLKGIDGHKSTLDSLTLGYLALELIPVLITMVLCSFFGFSFLISWLLILALVLDLIIYAIVFKFKKSLENSSGAFAVALIASLCEGVILANLGSSIDSTLFSAELAILISSFAIASIFAKILENGYVANSGRRIGLIVLCNMVILFMIFIPTELFPLVFYI